LGAILTGPAEAADPTISAVYGVYSLRKYGFPEKNSNFVDVDNVDAVDSVGADSVGADSVDAEKVESPTPTPTVSTVYEIPAKPEESEVFVDVDNVDDSSQLYPGGRLFPGQQQLPD
jgi:hypothetical protein